MKTSRLSLIVAGLLVAVGLTGCGYAKQADVDLLRGELYATQDSLLRLWNQTRSYVLAQTIMDTIVPPPKCPGPNCPKFEAMMTVYRQPFPPLPEWNRLGVQTR